LEDGVGGGFAATNPILIKKPLDALSFRPKGEIS
jgi:hypothetical protein